MFVAQVYLSVVLLSPLLWFTMSMPRNATRSFEVANQSIRRISLADRPLLRIRDLEVVLAFADCGIRKIRQREDVQQLLHVRVDAVRRNDIPPGTACRC
jgi:hypothetical protein